MVEIKYELIKDELLELLADYNCETSKKRKYLMIDFNNKTKFLKYFNNYIEAINSLNNIHSINVFEFLNDWYQLRKLEINIYYDIYCSIEDNFEKKVSGKYLSFAIRINKKNAIVA